MAEQVVFKLWRTGNRSQIENLTTVGTAICAISAALECAIWIRNDVVRAITDAMRPRVVAVHINAVDFTADRQQHGIVL